MRSACARLCSWPRAWRLIASRRLIARDAVDYTPGVLGRAAATIRKASGPYQERRAQTREGLQRTREQRIDWMDA